MFLQRIESLNKAETDTLLILHFKIDRSVPKSHVDKLVFNNWVTKIPGGGWRSTGKARALIRKLT